MLKTRISDTAHQVVRDVQRDHIVREEIDWVGQLKANPPKNEAAIQELRAIMLRGVSGSLTRRGGGQAFAEDIVQDALLKVLGSLDTFAGKSRFTTWAMTIATRTGVSALRRQHFKNVSLEDITSAGETAHEPAADAVTVEDDTSRREVLDQLRQLVDQHLTDKQRTVMVAALEGMPMEEIARRMDSNRNAIYKLFHTARKKLKDGFASLGVESSDIHAMFN